ncbi:MULTISPECIES: sensor histidine kinase [Streptomyces]|uniref:Oxygen sensor histidine kinase NreB n=2 Tax=Streptomyces TaxID=1883 RepID=A0ABU4K4M2_9ACTN|nr:sensor histidine kinase [Streptomyces roseolus]MDX2292702.1 sensor histidine kinase [Streptomyces roseolus]
MARWDGTETAAGPAGDPGTADGEARWFRVLLHAGFFLLLGSSLTRFLMRHTGDGIAPWVVALSAVLAALYVAEPAIGDERRHRHLWLGACAAVWVALVLLAPSFAWCSIPLFYLGLRHLRPPAAGVLVGLLTVVSVTAQLRLAGRFEFDLLLAPPAVAAICVAVFVRMDEQTRRQRELIADLVRTRRELAATERREGTLAERQRLSMEIHDSLAQGLSSQRMLLQAADRTWRSDPATAHRHVRAAGEIAERNLTEARRFVHDLAPADLAGGGGLDEALRTLARRESTAGLAVRCHIEGVPPRRVPDRVQSALLRIAQGALANVREHAAARTAALTLTYLDDQVVLDVADDGRGFDPAAVRADGGVRGHGLPAIRTRTDQLGGTLTVESAPGEGTVLSAAVPLPAV